MPEITVADLSVEYGDAVALDGVGFSVNDGEFLTLLGPSGCGKTTTLMSIAGLIKPDNGLIRCGDVDFFDSQEKVYLQPEERNCGVMFQSYAVWPHMTVAENVAYPLKVRKVPRRERDERVGEALALVDMADLRTRHPHELSGGQQQRVALARALVFSPSVLLLDEPLSNLDAKLREQARTWLKETQAKVGVTTIYVTHDQDEALSLSDRIIVMDKGAIRQIGSPEEIWSAPADPFVAGFIGSTNLLPGRVVASDPTRLAVQIGEEFVIELPPDSAASGDVLVAIRPERIVVRSHNDDANRSAPARVISRMFLGSVFHYHLDVDGVEMTAASPDRVDGTQVDVHLPAEHCRTFPDRGRSS